MRPVGAAATICNISSRLLSTALGTSIGLYRTSLLARDGFGVGRHPTSGATRAQDFSFAYEILEADIQAPHASRRRARTRS
jgi:hypothetical protein